MKHPKYAHSFEVVVDLPVPLHGLKTLASNLYWSWNADIVDLFRQIDEDLWEVVEHNPLQLLDRVSPDRLQRLAGDENFLAQLSSCEGALERYLSSRTWFDDRKPNRGERDAIAYFCAEFGIAEALPIYSGGLGILAGDHLKAASDLGIPLVGVGLLYSRGYFRQSLTHDGWQQERYPEYDFFKMPLQLVRGEDGHAVQVKIELPDRIITCQVWSADVGRIKLYLLDSNVMENAPADQSITDTLYGGDQEMRIRQEIILGVGGMRALKAVGVRPVVCHMNEGHAAFLSIERIRQFKEEFGCDTKTARKVVVSSNVFTTHTPVPAGFDLFTDDLLKKYVSKLIEPLEIPFDDFVKLGRIERDNQGEAFNMAVFAMENANFVNGVSELHAKVTRSMFQARWPGYPEVEVPVEAVTNGIHTSTWIHQRMAELFDRYLPENWRTEPEDRSIWQKVHDIPDESIWEIREALRSELVRFARHRIKSQLQHRGTSMADIAAVDEILAPHVLTLGFARRFATYKRATLMLSDRERLKSMMFHPERPVQIVIAGKSHPRDDGGKALIQDLYRFMTQEGARTRMVFLEDYDMNVARHLVQGVDVWLNNPRRPHEASGTSGMKVVPNGGLNCSILDGWWDEGYSEDVGWAIGDRRDYPDQGQQDWLDSHSLYHLIEAEIAPKFYLRSGNGVPGEWVRMIKESIIHLAPVFSTSRMVSDYSRKFYEPAWTAYENLAQPGLQRAKSALEWRERMRSEFQRVSIRSVHHSAQPVNSLNSTVTITAQVELNGLSNSDVKVEAVFGLVGPGRELIEHEVVELLPAGEIGEFSGSIELAKSGQRGFSVRVVPHHQDIVIPGELNLVTWEPT